MKGSSRMALSSFLLICKVFEPLSFDKWDALKSFNTFSDNAIYATGSNFGSEASTFVNSHFDWKETPEAHIVEAPGGKVFEPLSFDKWDPLESFNTFSDNAIYATGSNFGPEASTFVNSYFDWKKMLEAHIIEADGGKVFEPLSFDKWDPLENFNTFSDNAIYTSGSNFMLEASIFADSHFDWKETPKAHIVEADLPSIIKEDVKVEIVEGGVLQIRGERKREQEEKTHRWHRIERGNGKFLRRFPLPANVKVDQVKASMKNGVDVKKPKVKSIEISERIYRRIWFASQIATAMC